MHISAASILECYLTQENVNFKDEYEFKCHLRYKTEDINLIGCLSLMGTANANVTISEIIHKSNKVEEIVH